MGISVGDCRLVAMYRNLLGRKLHFCASEQWATCDPTGGDVQHSSISTFHEAIQYPPTWGRVYRGKLPDIDGEPQT